MFVLPLHWSFIWCGKFTLFIHIYKYRMSDLSFSGRTPFNIPLTSSFLPVRALTNQPPEQVSFTDTFISFTDISHFHSNLCHAAHTAAYHTNWLLEHQTWQILQGLRDIADMYPALMEKGDWGKKPPKLLFFHKCLTMLCAKVSCARLRKWDLSAYLAYIGSKYKLPLQ